MTITARHKETGLAQLGKMDTIGVTSRAFSRNPQLKAALEVEFPTVKYNETGRTLTPSELVSFLKDCRGAIVSLERIDSSVLDELPNLKVISKYGVGLDGVDLDALSQKGIELGWRGGLNRRSVAELTLSMMLVGVRRSFEASLVLKAGHWNSLVGGELSGKTIGLVGCGHIGKEVVRLLQPFDCRILAHDLQDFPEFYQKYKVQPVDLESLLTQADVVSLHVPLTIKTKALIHSQNLSLLKPGAVLINTARGGIIDEAALLERLKSADLHCGLDVFEVEPAAGNPLTLSPRVFCTPHVGGGSQEAQWAMGQGAIQGLREHFPIEDMRERKLLPFL